MAKAQTTDKKKPTPVKKVLKKTVPKGKVASSKAKTTKGVASKKAAPTKVARSKVTQPKTNSGKATTKTSKSPKATKSAAKKATSQPAKSKSAAPKTAATKKVNKASSTVKKNVTKSRPGRTQAATSKSKASSQSIPNSNIPRAGVSEKSKEPGKTIVSVRNLKMYFPVTQGIVFQKSVGWVKAVDDVSFDVAQGETLGLVGESGCGKTTTGRCILQLTRPTSGTVTFEGREMTTMSHSQLRDVRKQIQVIFQDPYSSLNPRMSIGEIVGEAPRIHGLTEGKSMNLKKVKSLLNLAGLPSNLVGRFPHELSGGQRQRVGIARALSVDPKFIVCDEAVSALDVSIQAQIINLLEDLQQEFGLTYLFIAHDLSVVRHISNRIAVMYLGKIAELAEADHLYSEPLHPYTEALLSAVPIPDPAVERERKHIILQGEVPSPLNPPSGCVFHPRCSKATEICRSEIPEFTEKRPRHFAACHHVN